MKRTDQIIKGLRGTLVAAVLLIAFTGLSQDPKESRLVGDKQSEEKGDYKRQERDAQFLVRAAEMNLAAIRLAQLAQQKGGSAQVKELGKKMEDAHTKSLNDLTALAKSKKITIPTSSTDNAQEVYKKLKLKSGNEFDRAYAELMVTDHQDAIAAFEKASLESSDTDIQDWATVSLAELRTHLDHSIRCKATCNRL